MKKTVLVVCTFALLLIMPPMVMIVTGWHWSQTQFNSMKWILWLTDTAGAPYSILTSLLFLGAVAFIFVQKKTATENIACSCWYCITAARFEDGIKKYV